MRVLTVVGVVALTYGCSGPSYEARVEAGKASLAKKEYRVGIAELKSALQMRPDSAEVRYLLGRALLESGDLAAAVVELNKASEVGHDPAHVAPSLARAMLLAGRHKNLVERFANVELEDPRALADLKTSVARAYIQLGRQESADTVLNEALAADPRSVPARITRAAFAAGRGDFDGALAISDEVLAEDPKVRDAWVAKGELLLYAKRDLKGSAAAFRKAIELDGEYLPAYVQLFLIALSEGDIASTEAAVKDLTTRFPKHQQTLHAEARLALLKGDLGRARDIVQTLLKGQPESALFLHLAGSIEFKSNAALQAERYLAKALSLAPGSASTRRLLALTYIRLGQPEKALGTLRPLLDPKQADGEALALAAEAHLLDGKPLQAEALYVQASKVAPGSSKVRTALALFQLGKGNADGAFAELETIAAADAGPYADFALVTARMRRKDFGSALKAIDALAKKVPRQPFVPYLRGQVLLAKGDTAPAQAAFEEALAIDALYFPASASLAQVDLTQGNVAKARGRFDQILRTDPKNVRALMAIAELLTLTDGKRGEIEALLRQAVSLNPTEPQARLALLRHLASGNDTRGALTEAQAAAAALPDHRDVLEAVARAQADAKEWQQAISTYSKLAAAMPKSALPHVRLAEVHLATKDYKLATQSLNKALQITPELLEAKRGLIAIALNDKRYIDALALAKQVQRERAKEEVGFVLEGDIEAKRSQWEAALAAYRSGMQRKKTPELASKIHVALVALNRAPEAGRFAASWEKDRPNDLAFAFYMGDQHLARGEYALAEAKYRAIVKVKPDHALALNNIAATLLLQGKPGALPLATRADELMPNHPDIMDTLAGALLADDQLPRAREVQSRAVNLQPERPSLKLTLAKIYLRSGDKVQARVELEKLVALGETFAGAKEAQALLATAR